VKRENPRRDVPRRPINSRYSQQIEAVSNKAVLYSRNRAVLYSRRILSTAVRRRFPLMEI